MCKELIPSQFRFDVCLLEKLAQAGAPAEKFGVGRNFKPEHTLFCCELNVVAIQALLGDLWAKKSSFLGQKQCFLGKKCTIT